MSRVIKIILLYLCALIFVAPMIITMICSLMTPAELTSIFVSQEASFFFIPRRISLDGYFSLLFSTDKYLAMFWNSVFIAVCIAGGNVIVSLPVGYLLAKVRFKGRNLLCFVYIVTMMMPFQVTILPNYIMVRALNLYNTNGALIIPGIFAPFGVFLITQYFRGISDEMVEAAALETNSPVRLLARMIAPSAYPGLLALFLLSFSEAWNMVEQPLILLRDEWRYPLSLALYGLQQDDFSMAFCGAVLYLAPMMFLYRVFEKELIEGVRVVRF